MSDTEINLAGFRDFHEYFTRRDSEEVLLHSILNDILNARFGVLGWEYVNAETIRRIIRAHGIEL